VRGNQLKAERVETSHGYGDVVGAVLSGRRRHGVVEHLGSHATSRSGIRDNLPTFHADGSAYV
jgi:hypothetical protein